MNNETTKSRHNVLSGANETVDAALKSKNFVTVNELERLLKGAAKTRHPVRNQAMILMMFWHGLRVTELCQLNDSDLDIDAGRLYVKRIKNSLSTTHPMRSEVLRTIKRYRKIRGESFRPLFLTERGDQFTRSPINYILKRSAKLGGLGFSVNPHMLRHGCGFALANMGHDTRLIQDYLGHKDIKNTVIYTRTTAKRFEKIWDAC
jgi:integrase